MSSSHLPRPIDAAQQQIAQNIRNKITPRMEQVTRCVTSQGFCNALQESLANPETSRSIMSPSNLRALGAPLPAGANIEAVGAIGLQFPVSGFEVTVYIPPVAVDFSFPSSSGVQATLRSATKIAPSAAVQTIRNMITPRMEQVTQCVTSPAFCNALAEVSSQYGSGSNMSQARTYLQGILTSDNLRRRGVPVPTGSTIRAGLNISYRIELIYPPLSVRFNYPEQLTHGSLPV